LHSVAQKLAPALRVARTNWNTILNDCQILSISDQAIVLLRTRSSENTDYRHGELARSLPCPPSRSTFLFGYEKLVAGLRDTGGRCRFRA